MRSPFSHLIVALCVCAAAAGAYGVGYASIASLSAAAADLKQRIDAKTESANRVASARTAIAEIAGDESVVRNYFVPETGVVAFIDDLETRGRALGAAVDVLSVSKGTTKTQPTLLFSLTAQGTFSAVMRTVGSIEYAPYDLFLSGLSVGEDAPNRWHADLRVTVGSVAASTTRASADSAPRVPARSRTP